MKAQALLAPLFFNRLLTLLRLSPCVEGVADSMSLRNCIQCEFWRKATWGLLVLESLGDRRAAIAGNSQPNFANVENPYLRMLCVKIQRSNIQGF